MFPNYPGGHEAYQDFMVRRKRDHYANPAEPPSGLLDIAERFWRKDLTEVNTIMRGVALDSRIVENAALMEMEQALINLKHIKKQRMGASEHG